MLRHDKKHVRNDNWIWPYFGNFHAQYIIGSLATFTAEPLAAFSRLQTNLHTAGVCQNDGLFLGGPTLWDGSLLSDRQCGCTAIHCGSDPVFAGIFWNLIAILICGQAVGLAFLKAGRPGVFCKENRMEMRFYFASQRQEIFAMWFMPSKLKCHTNVSSWFASSLPVCWPWVGSI